jgi:hypothetical protein
VLRTDPERPGWGCLNQWDRRPCLSMTRELFYSRYEYMAELFYRRKLPHWRQDQVTYFVTWRLAREQWELDSNERDLVMTAIRKFDGRRYELAAYVVMNDHVHVLLAPLAPLIPGSRSRPVRSNTSINGLGGCGRTSTSTASCATTRSLRKRVSISSGNPRKRWPEVQEYPWVWPPEL